MNAPGTGINTRRWQAIWTRPGEAWPAIINAPLDLRIILLSGLAGMPPLLLLLAFSELFTPPLILLLSVLLGSVLGLLGIHILGLFLAWSSRWLGGRRDHASCRAIAAWSMMPLSVGVVPIALLVMLLKIAPKGGQDAVFIAALVSLLSLVIWSLVLLFKGVRMLTGFSTTRSAMNALSATLMAAALLAMIIGGTAVVLAMGIEQTIGSIYKTGALIGGK
jgi:hypothetical protein